MREHLGVGLGDELHALGDELGAQLVGVLDDAVVHDGDALVGRQVRVGVLVARHAVGGPAGVPDAERPLELGGYGLGQVSHAAFDLAQLEASVGHHHPSRVVASVLQTLESLQQDRGRVLGADIGDDSAHASLL
ncbi:hypothetical protein GCM10020219_020890 [Nonomuraea dietziae]